MRHALGAGVGAVRRGERVVDEDVGQLRQGGGEGRVVLFLLGMEAGVLQHQHIARAPCARPPARPAMPMQSSAKRTALAQHLAQSRGHRRQRHLRHALALRAIEMAADDDLRALADQFADGRRQPLDPRQVGDLAVADRHIEVGPQQHALAGDVEVVECAEGHGDRLRLSHGRVMVPATQRHRRREADGRAARP